MEEPNNNVHKCKRRGCSGVANSRCASVLCKNWVCTKCYEERVLSKFELPALPNQNDIPLVACTKKCYQNAMKDISGEGRRAWDTDTPTREYLHSSEAMLIDWLLVHGNYAKWKGNNAGISKREIQKEIADSINRKGAERGIQRGRAAEQVGAKIFWIESKFRETKQWIENTGQGILEEIGEQSFKEKVEKERFKHFYTLEPIMSERACMGAKVTTDIFGAGESSPGEDDDEAQDAEELQHQSPVREITFRSPRADSDDDEKSDRSAIEFNVDSSDIEDNGANAGVGTGNNGLAGAGNDVEIDGRSIRSVATSAQASRSSRSAQQKRRAGPTTTSRAPKNRKASMEHVVATLNDSRKDDRELHLRELEETIRHNRELELIEKEKARVTDETIRHNREMEAIEKEKARVTFYESIQKNMDLYRNSRTMYEELRQTMTLEEIAHSLPNCVKCFDFSVMSEEDRQKFAKYYNDWAISNGIPDRIDLTFI